MKILTICQPFAHLIVTGEKRVENRVWATSYRGPLVIHAGKSRDWLEADDAGMDEEYGIPLTNMAFGAIVGIADLIDCKHIEAILKMGAMNPMSWLQTHEHTEGPWCFVLANVRRLVTPIFYRGAQGLTGIAANVLDGAEMIQDSSTGIYCSK